MVKKAIFLTNRSEVQSGMTGNVRRTALPFLWAILLGMHQTRTPDEDNLVQSALQICHVYMIMKGINQAHESQGRTEEDIAFLQEQCSYLGRILMETFNMRACTKPHRLMEHVSDHVRDYGDLCYGNTSTNESLNKATKSSYQATNKRESELGGQLLNVRTGSAHVIKKRKLLSEREHVPDSATSALSYAYRTVEISEGMKLNYISERNVADNLFHFLESVISKGLCASSADIPSIVSEYNSPLGATKFFEVITKIPITACFSWTDKMLR